MTTEKLTEKLTEFFEEQEFQVHLTVQDNQQCAEVEMWTDGGVDMIIWLNPFTIEEFKSYVKDFDIDNEIELHRQGDDYKKAFTIRESLKDFTKYHNHLKKMVKLLDKTKKVLLTEVKTELLRGHVEKLFAIKGDE